MARLNFKPHPMAILADMGYTQAKANGYSIITGSVEAGDAWKFEVLDHEGDVHHFDTIEDVEDMVFGDT